MTMALGSGVRQAMARLGIGIVAALALTRVLNPLLHGVRRTIH
jgi:hypothetical protein